ncbi:unnamed protein product [Acanthoscelides obtectus]|uniref:Uncharacterized protein n=1 Tax=Acanthoscelides obtectus TaxID=200917 RepID=A0A9P0MCW7_ACAOB|nr:unnamed protein product [Acanthoscelides obtectus]CAK1630002.1 hypothetical protein AOBTE_LOCUS6092 [Acanthoscelides obtectus]
MLVLDTYCNIYLAFHKTMQRKFVIQDVVKKNSRTKKGLPQHANVSINPLTRYPHPYDNGATELFFALFSNASPPCSILLYPASRPYAGGSLFLSAPAKAVFKGGPWRRRRWERRP